MEVTADDCRWLVSPSASPYLETVAAAPSEVAALKTLRKELTPARASLVIEQASLRKKARQKFSRADQMFFLRTLLEQATDEYIARYKARRIPDEESVVDICCGIGGDLIGIAGRGPARGVDLNPVAAIFAEANAAVYGTPVDVVVQNAMEYRHERGVTWHIDPDRRIGGDRHTNAAFFEPGVDWIDTLRHDSPNGAVKLAPATETPIPWTSVAELEWIGSRRECRQQVIWFGQLAASPGKHRATVVDAEDRAESILGVPSEPTTFAERIGDYICEPQAAVLAAKLLPTLAEQCRMQALAPRVAYLTGSSVPGSRLVASFKTLEVLPFDFKKLKTALRVRNVGRLEIKARGVDVKPDQLRRKLDLHGDDELTVLIAGTRDGARAILAKRIDAA